MKVEITDASADSVNVDDMVVRSKIRLQTVSPFFSYLVQTLNVTVEEIESKSAQVDIHGNVKLHPAFIADIGEPALMGVLCHEIMHVALHHFERTSDRDNRLANIAQDIVINDIIIQNSLTLPNCALIPTKQHSVRIKSDLVIYDIDKKSWEEIYEELKSTCSEDDDISSFDICVVSEETEQSVDGKLNAQRLLSDAYSYAKLQGNIPNGISSRLGELLKSKVNWKTMLHKYITNTIPYDYSFSRPSKRSSALGVYFPSVRKSGLNVVLALDTSGSIAPKELQRFATEALSIMTSFEGVTATLIQADCEIQKAEIISGNYRDTVKNIEVSGGGGTSHLPVFEYISKHVRNANLIVCFTDGYTDYPEKQPRIPTIWAINNKIKKAPFGNTVFVGD